MEIIEEMPKSVCYGCLCTNGEYKIHSYIFRSSPLHNLIQMDSIPLCYVCRRIAQHTELFVQNVQSNQILLANYHNAMDIPLQSMRAQVQPVINLSCGGKSSQIIECSHNTSGDTTVDCYEVTGNSCDDEHDVNMDDIKIEVKKEDLELSNQEEDFTDNCEDFDDQVIKEEDEDEFPLKMLQEARVDLDNVDLKSLSKSIKNNKVKTQDKHQLKHERTIDRKILRIYLSEEQCMTEHEKLSNDTKYLRSTFKCEDCFKGFCFKDSYDKHMKRHCESNGALECGICKQRMVSEDKLASHSRYHYVRYKCTECDLIRTCRQTVRDHITAFHCQDLYQYACTHPGCDKIYKRQASLRKHRVYTHECKERVSCQFCLKTYVTKEVLKTHMIMQHPKEMSAGEIRKRFICQHCGAGFKTPSQLKLHSLKHTEFKASYCVECDKSFKSEYILKHHLKTAAPHVNYVELPLVCAHCDKRFGIKRDLERHMNRVHLNIKPFKCDKCDKAYVSAWSLTEHKRYIHEGYKRPLRFPCSMCDKVFDRKQILKSHVRTHTGERPFACARCPASFSQRGVLATHVRLVHLRLARDGRPKHAQTA